jgi:hypothetical protein
MIEQTGSILTVRGARTKKPKEQIELHERKYTKHTRIHTHTDIYIYIYIYVCMDAMLSDQK